MRTSSSNNESTKVSLTLQDDLAQYGLTRDKAAKQAPVRSSGEPNFFGMKETGSKTELKFGGDIAAIQKAGMTVSLVAPENESFNMIVTKDFRRAVAGSTEDTLRSFVRRIFDKV